MIYYTNSEITLQIFKIRRGENNHITQKIYIQVFYLFYSIW